MMTFANAAKRATYAMTQKMDFNTQVAIHSSYNKRSVNMNPQVGDGVTIKGYSDCKACTVIKRTKSSIVIQRDSVERLDAPIITPGGFAGHCSNQREIRYNCTPNPQGYTETYTRRNNGKWVRKGDTKKGTSVFMGKHEFYDYNF